MNIEYIADMFILTMCVCIVGYYIAQRANVYIARYKAKKMHEQFTRKGFTLMTTDSGEQWYVGYGNPYDD